MNCGREYWHCDTSCSGMMVRCPGQISFADGPMRCAGQIRIGHADGDFRCQILERRYRTAPAGFRQKASVARGGLSGKIWGVAEGRRRGSVVSLTEKHLSLHRESVEASRRDQRRTVDYLTLDPRLQTWASVSARALKSFQCRRHHSAGSNMTVPHL